MVVLQHAHEEAHSRRLLLLQRCRTNSAAIALQRKHCIHCLQHGCKRHIPQIDATSG